MFLNYDQSSVFTNFIPLREALDAHEREVIEKAVKKFGSQRKAAQILELDQATISEKLKGYVSNF